MRRPNCILCRPPIVIGSTVSRRRYSLLASCRGRFSYANLVGCTSAHGRDAVTDLASHSLRRHRRAACWCAPPMAGFGVPQDQSVRERARIGDLSPVLARTGLRNWRAHVSQGDILLVARTTLQGMLPARIRLEIPTQQHALSQVSKSFLARAIFSSWIGVFGADRSTEFTEQPVPTLLGDTRHVCRRFPRACRGYRLRVRCCSIFGVFDYTF
jgi:hypothetical protein